MKVSQQIRSYASDDIASIIKMASHRSDVNFKLVSLKFDMDDHDIDTISEDEDVTVMCTATIKGDDKTFEFSWEYLIDGEDIFIEDEERNLAISLCDRFDEAKASVKSSTTTKHKTRIVAADDDFDEMTDEEDDGFIVDDDDSVSDSLDDLSDQVEDIQDQVDEVQEDDVSIDTDNNITNHYIAECDNCHGIFISAVIESDQHVEKITGVCPLCQKESEQYLKWVVKDANTDDDEF